MVVRCEDGIVDPCRYGAGIDGEKKLRVLWILKEPHDEEQSYSSILDGLRKQADEGTVWNTYWPTWRKIAQTSCGLLKEGQTWSEWSGDRRLLSSVLRSIAAINVKKTGGGSRAKWPELVRAFTENEEQLRVQVAEAQPDLVVGGNVLGLFREWFGRGWPVNPTRERFDSWAHDGAVWVHAYHPGCRPATISDEQYFKNVHDAFLRERCE